MWFCGRSKYKWVQLTLAEPTELGREPLPNLEKAITFSQLRWIAITILSLLLITGPCVLVMNLAGRYFAPGLSYVAISRVKALDDLLFETPFDFEL